MATTESIERSLDTIVTKLRNHYQPQRIVLFGSWAHGKADSDSDIDLLIIKDTRERLIDRCAHVRRILSSRKRTVPLEVLVLTPGELEQRLATGDQFIADILKSGRVLHAA